MTKEQEYITFMMSELSGCKYLYDEILDGMKQIYIYQKKEVIDEYAWETALFQALGLMGFKMNTQKRLGLTMKDWRLAEEK